MTEWPPFSVPLVLPDGPGSQAIAQPLSRAVGADSHYSDKSTYPAQVGPRRVLQPAESCGQSSSRRSCRKLAQAGTGLRGYRARPTEPSRRGMLSSQSRSAGPDRDRGGCTRWPMVQPEASCQPRLCYLILLGRVADRRANPAGCARPARRPNEEVCRPSSLIRLGWPDRAYGPARPAPLARLSRHSEACCHAGPTRLVRARADSLNPIGSPVPNL